ncbi:Serine/threonine-protein kinase [Durusdinium trenchii]|uniref:Serine/threonine-protein kinase n=1 Tax=Durusdinium trenchii TaxID=1381693 RepID=A0ABP0RPF3_9DINO
MHEHSGGYGGGMGINSTSLSDLLAPTIRERKPSKMGLDVMGGYRRDSAVHLGDLPGDTPECCEPHEPTPHNSSIAGDNVGMVREESCSNLFDDLIQTEDTQPDKSEFEDKYALVGNGPLGEGTFGLVWRCTPKGKLKEVREDKEFAAKIVRKAPSRLVAAHALCSRDARDMKYLLGEDGEAGWMHLLEWPSKSKG